jgi:GTP cyclohydrolase II
MVCNTLYNEYNLEGKDLVGSIIVAHAILTNNYNAMFATMTPHEAEYLLPKKTLKLPLQIMESILHYFTNQRGRPMTQQEAKIIELEAKTLNVNW